MATVQQQHAEWLSLLEISGPFLSLEVLNKVFPQGVDMIEPARASELRAAYEEWSVEAPRDPRFHRQWVLYVLQTLLGWDDTVLAEGQAIPEPFHYTAVEHGGEQIRPTFILHERRQPNVVRAMVSVYTPEVALDKSLPRTLWSASPAARMLALLHATGVQIGLVTNGEQWMLVSASKTGMAGFISWYGDLWNEERLTLRAFVSLLEARRFFGVADEDTIGAMLLKSADDAQEVTDQLGMQVRQAVEILVRALDRCDQDTQGALLEGVPESRLYEAALTVMMRLVFLLSAEERGLFLLGDELYDQNYAISTLRAQLHEAADRTGEEVLERRSDAWSRLLATFRLVYYGASHQDLKLPAYGGSLFDPGRFPFLEGGQTGTPPAVDNRTVLHLLDALQILQTRGEARRLSFRALDIEQIGHVYEGLLDHKARRADQIILGFDGTKNQQPEIPLSELESQSDLNKYLKDMTGRSPGAIKNGLKASPDGERLRRLYDLSCRSDRALFDRVMPYLNLLRDDEFGNPLVIHPGSVYVTSGTERRATGTHYTPRSLTEPIVEHTLEPLVYRGVAEGLPPEAWELKSPREILSLKVCDMAMGSGAFLVQACRYLGARLIEAWERRIEAEDTPIPCLTIDGEPPTGALTEILIPDDPNERMTLALRLIADRCLYGVDKNPLASEMAKLSLWLTTLAKGRPFTFLDHALKCGDSLVGVNLDQLRNWTLDLSDDPKNVPLLVTRVRLQIDEVVKLRQQIESFTVNTVQDQQEKARLLAEADARTHDLRVAGNLLLASYFNTYSKKEQAAMRGHLLEVVQKGTNVPEGHYAPVIMVEKLPPFHWELEFPEVFIRERGGFDAFVGNPPFMGGRIIGTVLGDSYRDFIAIYKNGVKGSADLCAYFFLRGINLIGKFSSLGLIATNSITDTDTRTVGLEQIIGFGKPIYRADKDVPWPGNASVVISVVHIFSTEWLGMVVLDGQPVKRITSNLDTFSDETPFTLNAIAGNYSQGISVMGEGFVLSEDERRYFIEAEPKNGEIIYGYFIGDDLNNLPEIAPRRWIINFGNMELEIAKQYTLLFERVENTVKPFRDGLTGQIHERYFWKYWDKRPKLQKYQLTHDRALAIAVVTKYIAFQLVPLRANVFNHKVKLLFFDKWSEFALLQSSIHDIWSRWRSGRLGATTTNYSTSDALDTFPFPLSEFLTSVENIGQEYHETRRQIMLNRQEGLTATYNRFHNPDEHSDDIQYLRDLHRQMDEAVAAAYGWDDLPLEHDFHDTAQGVRYTISETARREVLKRLLALNFERYEEEQRLGVGVDVKKGKRGKKVAANAPSNDDDSNGDVGDPNAMPPDQLSFLDDGEPKQKRLF